MDTNKLRRGPLYFSGDRQQNSCTLAEEIVKYMLIDCEKSDIDIKAVSKLLEFLLIMHFSWFDCDELNKKIDHFEFYKAGKRDMPVDLSKGFF